MFSKKFLLDTAERALKTFAQSIVGTVVLCGGSGLTEAPMKYLSLNWGAIFALAGIMAGLSVCTSIASSFKGDKDSASLVK